MKSKSFDLKISHAHTEKPNKSHDFVGLYKPAAETDYVKLLEKPKTVENLDKTINIGSLTHVGTKSRENSSNKKKRNRSKSVDISQLSIDGGNSLPDRDSSATSTPLPGRKASGDLLRVKSIMKNCTTNADETMESVPPDTPAKSKKRNKSVSFMLEDTDEVASKKTKPDNTVKEKKHKKDKDKAFIDKKKLKKLKKQSQAEKENKANISMEAEETPSDENGLHKQEKIHKAKDKTQSSKSDVVGESSDTPSSPVEKKKKIKKLKKHKKVEENSPMENDSNNNEDASEVKPQKLKKKKRPKTQLAETSEGEPASKVKKEVKAVAEDLENLSIGDNAHTLTNLLDEMTVVDKDKKKKNKQRRKKDKSKVETTNKTGSVSSSETADLEKIEEGKEKVKWKKRKWNKDRKGEFDEDLHATTVIIENLPLTIMCTYRKMLADHFGKLGLIKRIGIAEMYPTEDPKPVFTTSIVFYSEGAAEQALEEDNMLFEGSRIRIRRPLPPTETTVVVHSYAELTEQSISSIFTSCGRIRNIRHLIKGKKSKATAFIEFDGPESVEKALKMAEDAKIGGKKVHVAKFEIRGPRRKMQKKSNPESENEGDSEDSND